MLSISSIDAAPWVAICAAKYLNLQFPTRLIKQRSKKIPTMNKDHYLFSGGAPPSAKLWADWVIADAKLF